MDAHTGILTRSDDSQLTPADTAAVDHEHDTGNTAPNEDPYNLTLPSNVHSSLATNGSDDIGAHKEQSPFKPDEEPVYIPTEGDRTLHESDYASLTLPMITEDVPPSEFAVVLAGGPPSSTNDGEAPANFHPQESLPLCARTVLEISTLGDSEADSDYRFNPIQTLHTALNQNQDSGPARAIDEAETREDFDYPCDPSLPPSSSPPQIFSSSPYASSQSSTNDAESSNSKMVLAIEAEYYTASRDYTLADNVVAVVKGDLVLESEDLHNHDSTEVAASLETEEDSLQTGPTSFIKRSADHDESCKLEPMKRPKLDAPDHPPVPKRATLASQNHQFKKLTAPFRPPRKIPIVTDGLAKMTSSMKVESTNNTAPETNRDKIDRTGSTTTFQHKASNTPKSLTQFKSPLVNRVLPADSRTVRLTPALQALERKLQLLKRAIKVKEDHEEEVLTRLATKWIEAGREVAYEVWGATKDSGDFTGKATSIRRSYGWESTNEGNVPWGWDTKAGGATEESCDLNPLKSSRTLGSEEEDDIGCNTLGTMIRQLGIDPEIFGWDDDKETFSD